jgi:hypothetical protein
MPEERVRKRAQRAKSEGKSPSTQAGEFVREEIHHVREGKHGARSAKQAIAIGLSKARRAGVDVSPPEPGKSSEDTRKSAQRDYDRGHGKRARPSSSPRRKRAAKAALQREGRAAGSRRALSRQAHTAAKQRSPRDRSEAAVEAARTKGPRRRRVAAQKAARTRARRQSASG